MCSDLFDPRVLVIACIVCCVALEKFMFALLIVVEIQKLMTSPKRHTNYQKVVTKPGIR